MSERSESGKNRRVFPRVHRETPAWYELNGTFQRCVALDLGVGGAQLVTSDSLGQLPEFEVSFQLSEDWNVRAMARPVWERAHEQGYLVGITYRPLRSADKHLIGPWVHKQRKRSEESN